MHLESFMEDKMKKIIAFFLVRMNLAAALTIFFAVGSVNAQYFP